MPTCSACGMPLDAPALTATVGALVLVACDREGCRLTVAGTAAAAGAKPASDRPATPRLVVTPTPRAVPVSRPRKSDAVLEAERREAAELERLIAERLPTMPGYDPRDDD